MPHYPEPCGRDMEVFNHLSAQMADYLLLDPDLVVNVHANLMDEMLVTIIQAMPAAWASRPLPDRATNRS
ncbi:putative diguanylate cyclase [Leclercia adecarboxylata]|uniref:Putative diguanylate cyclase n=1 Tax=Leclercia adecarboxylata TaxID=83655 RepID=A0A4U9I2F1_9ENTR|nr:putative diguanylate cyclase [Leclercia adecarboxylata]